jgi:hypothetical protein
VQVCKCELVVAFVPIGFEQSPFVQHPVPFSLSQKYAESLETAIEVIRGVPGVSVQAKHSLTKYIFAGVSSDLMTRALQ